jgi:hypothetical protein
MNAITNTRTLLLTEKYLKSTSHLIPFHTLKLIRCLVGKCIINNCTEITDWIVQKWHVSQR